MFLIGDQGDEWHKASQSFTVKGEFKLEWKVTRGSSYIGDVAIDDVTVKTGMCS